MTASRRTLASALFVAAACLAGPAGANATPDQDVTTRIAWRSCPGVHPAGSAQCATVRVPLDWSHPDAGTIALAVARRRAAGPGRRIGSLFFNPGGPGQSGVAVVQDAGAAASLMPDGGGRLDLVSWDPRGAGSSTRVRCASGQAQETAFWADQSLPAGRAGVAPYLAKLRVFQARCRRITGRLLHHISTADTARDLDRLRHLVGDRRLTYYGVSYGTFIGETYANLFPHRVRAMAIDSVVDPRRWMATAEDRTANNVAASDQVYRRLASTCDHAGAARCALAGHGTSALERVNALLDRLDREPIPAPNAAPPGALTRQDALLVLFQALGGPASWPQVAADLEAAVGGDGSALLEDARSCDDGCLLGMSAPLQAILCADASARHTARDWPAVIGRFGQVSRLRGALVGWLTWAPCTGWGRPDADRYTGPWTARTAHPVLVIGTRWDPNTPYANARRVAGLLGNARLLTHDGYGHISSSDPSACVQRALTAYLTRLVVPRSPAVCRSDREPFDPAFGS